MPKNSFSQSAALKIMESMRNPANGAFVASVTDDYKAMWLRDHLYCALAYLYLGEYEKFRMSMGAAFDYFKLNKTVLITRVASPIAIPGGILHAKVDSANLAAVTTDEGWGHHQTDALGLFLFVCAEADRREVSIARDEKEEDKNKEIIQLVVAYLRSVEYWEKPDIGMWEECLTLKMTSVGAVVAGLSHVKHQSLAIVPDPLIENGRKTLDALWPYESLQKCHQSDHRHDCDAGQLFLIWPYRVIVGREKQDELLNRIVNGHQTAIGETHCLMQANGFNRFWGDNYYRSGEAGGYISAEWPMFFFVLSIIYAERHEYAEAIKWLKRGCEKMVNGKVPEAFKDHKPNDHTPLAWGQALALIAFARLPANEREAFLSS